MALLPALTDPKYGDSYTSGKKYPGRPTPKLEVAQLTQVGIVPPAELPAATKAQVEGLLVWAPQFVSALDGSEGFLSVAVGDKAIVIPDMGGDQQQQLCLFPLGLQHPLE